MRTRPATLATATIAIMAVACNAAGSTTVLSGETATTGPRSQPPVMHVADHDFSAPPPPGADTEVAHVGRRSHPTNPADPTWPADPARVHEPAATDDPADVAAGLLIDLLAAEGLLVTSIDTHLERDDGDQAQVRVDVAHSPGHGHPVQSRYLLDLVRDAGRWRLAGFSEPD